MSRKAFLGGGDLNSGYRSKKVKKKDEKLSFDKRKDMPEPPPFIRSWFLVSPKYDGARKS